MAVRAVNYNEGGIMTKSNMLISVSKNLEWLCDASWDIGHDPRLSYEDDPSDVSIFTPGIGVMNCHLV